MIKWTDVILILILIPASALAGGMIACLEKFAGALISGRKPAYFFQPFNDFLSRIRTVGSELNRMQLYSAALHLILSMTACAILFMRDDLLLAIFAFLMANAVLIAGVGSLNSPYSRMGAKHETYKFVLYGTVLFIFAVCVKQVTGSFIIADMFKTVNPLFYRLPLLFMLVAPIIAVRAGKSPFNFSKEMLIEFNGAQTSILMLAGWFERVFLYSMVYLFLAQNPASGIMLAFAVFVMQTVSDKFLGDIKPITFLKWGSFAVMLLAGINLLWIFLGGMAV